MGGLAGGQFIGGDAQDVLHRRRGDAFDELRQQRVQRVEVAQGFGGETLRAGAVGGLHPGEGAGAARQLGQGFLIFENGTDQAMRGAARIHRAGGTIRAVAVLRAVALGITLGTAGPAAHGFAGSLSGAFVGAFMGAFAFGHASGTTGLAGAGSAGRIIGLAWGRHRALLAGLKSRGISWSVTEGSQR